MATKTREVLALPPVARDLLASVIYGYGFGAPTDAVTGAGEAMPGSLYVDQTNKVVYHNTGTLASPVWNSLGGVAASEITLAEGKVLIGNSSGVAEAQTPSGDATITAGGVIALAAQIINGADIANVADANVIGGVPVIFRIAVPSGANGDVDVVSTHKIRVINAWAVLKGAGTAGSTLTVKEGANAISDALDVSAGGDRDRFDFGEIDDAEHEIPAAGTLRVSKASAGADFPGAEVYVMALRIA